MGDITSTSTTFVLFTWSFFAVVRSCLFQELTILFSKAYEIQASKNIQNNRDHKKARYKLVFSITIKIKRAIFLSHAHGKEFIQMYKCLPSVVQSLKTVLKKVIMSHRYKFSHFILPCDINILLFSFAKVRESKEFCSTKVSQFHLSVHLAAWTWARQGGESAEQRYRPPCSRRVEIDDCDPTPTPTRYAPAHPSNTPTQTLIFALFMLIYWEQA